MSSISLSCLLVLFSFLSAECRPTEKNWGVNRGWGWRNWGYYWYWRQGLRATYSDRDTICQRLWNVDVNRLRQGVHYGFAPQAHVRERSNRDRAERKLFTYLVQKRVRPRPTFRTFMDLLSNFQPSSEGFSRFSEDITTIRNNIDAFLSEVLKTRVFQELRWFLVRNRLISTDRAKFKDDLFRIWFNDKNITRARLTAFQKVFVGETVYNPRKISFRNWIQFYNLESTSSLNYYGYLQTFTTYDPRIISPKFSWYNGAAVSDSILVGTTPEFELALYSMCFYLHPGKDCQCKVNTRNIVVKTVTSLDGSILKNADFHLKI